MHPDSASDIVTLHRGTAPLLVSLPHDGSAIPDGLAARMTPEARRAIYDRAGKALLGQLRTLQPPVPASDIANEEKALQEAIARAQAAGWLGNLATR